MDPGVGAVRPRIEHGSMRGLLILHLLSQSPCKELTRKPAQLGKRNTKDKYDDRIGSDLGNGTIAWVRSCCPCIHPQVGQRRLS